MASKKTDQKTLYRPCGVQAEIKGDYQSHSHPRTRPRMIGLTVQQNDKTGGFQLLEARGEEAGRAKPTVLCFSTLVDISLQVD